MCGTYELYYSLRVTKPQKLIMFSDIAHALLHTIMQNTATWLQQVMPSTGTGHSEPASHSVLLELGIKWLKGQQHYQIPEDFEGEMAKARFFVPHLFNFHIAWLVNQLLMLMQQFDILENTLSCFRAEFSMRGSIPLSCLHAKYEARARRELAWNKD